MAISELTQEVAELEQEVAEAEARCTHLRASLKAAIVEADAAQDPAQFDPDAFRRIGEARATRPADYSALLGFALGTVGGMAASILATVVF